MRQIGFIMFIAYVVWQVVYSLSQGAQKKGQQRRARELAEQRRRATTGSGPATTGSGSATTPSQLTTTAGPGASTRGTSRLDELAERRKRQLEQLRQRRIKQSGGAMQVRAGSPLGQAPPTAAAPSIPEVKSRAKPQSRLDADHASLRQHEESRKREREASRQRQQKQLKAKRRLEQQAAEAKAKATESRQLLEQKREHRKTAPGMATLVPAAVAATFAPDSPLRHDVLRARMGDHRMLRELFVLKELLDPPVAVRANHGAGMFAPEDPV